MQSSRWPSLVVAICAVGASGCMALSVSAGSAELHGGRLSLDAHDGPVVMAAAGIGWVFGFTINLEAEFVSTMGMGAGWTSVHLPATGSVAARTVSTAVANFWLETPIDLPGTSWLIPQTALGVQIGGEGKIRSAHLDLGAVLNGDGGRSMRVFVGPELFSTRDDDKDTESSGWGVQARVRLVQKFFPKCAHELPGRCL